MCKGEKNHKRNQEKTQTRQEEERVPKALGQSRVPLIPHRTRGSIFSQLHSDGSIFSFPSSSGSRPP